MARREPRSPTQHHPLLRTGPILTLLVLLSLAYNWYYLTGGFQGEDYMFVGMLRHEPLPFSRWLGFWSTADYPALTSLWWFEGQGVTPFWRPLPSLLIEGSVRLFGERAFPLHLLSVVVHGLVGGTLFLLVRRLTGRPLVALLADGDRGWEGKAVSMIFARPSEAVRIALFEACSARTSPPAQGST